MAFMGVRISWLILARNRLLASLAAVGGRAFLHGLPHLGDVHADGQLDGLAAVLDGVHAQQQRPVAGRSDSGDLEVVHLAIAAVGLVEP